MINKEGYRIIFWTIVGFAAICVAGFVWLGGVAEWVVLGTAVVLTLGVVAFFRDPCRTILYEEGTVFAPCDGRVVVAEKVRTEEYFGGRECLQVSIFMSLTNVHVNWCPVAGRIVYHKYHPGKFLVAWHPKSSELNEHTTTVIDTGHGEVLVRQIAGLVARRIVCYAYKDAVVEQNCRLGFIKFGSRIDVLLPLDAEILVKIGDKVCGSQMAIARLKMASE